MLSSIILSMAMSVSPAPVADFHDLDVTNINEKRGKLRINEKRGKLRINEKRGKLRINEKRGKLRI